jgi:transcriptional regulator with XRE-family HTH domain
MNALAAWIEERLRDQDLSQRDLGRKTGIAQATISTMLNQGHIPKHDVLVRLADYFGVSIFYVYKLAGYLPSNVNVGEEKGDPETVVALEEIVRILSKQPEEVRVDFLRQVRGLAAMLSNTRS